MTEQVRLLQEALRAQPSEDEEAEGDLAIEKMGDSAFDWIVAEMRRGCLMPAEAVRGLRLLSRLTRQFCVRRKGELLDLTLRLSIDRDAHRDVRSTAAHIATSSALIAKRLSDAPAAFGRPAVEVQDEVVAAVRRAIELGVTPDVEAFTKEFLMAIHKR